VPFASDPTQWLFNGHPKDADSPLHVAVARLVGYQWPRQTGSKFPDCPSLDADGLEAHADGDGIVCLSSVRGEPTAADRLLSLLADAYGSAADDGQRYTIERLYDALNSYGGTIGEALGVGLFAAISIGLLSIGLLRSSAIPRWIGVWSVISAIALALGAVELFGVDPGPLLTVTVTVVQLWSLATGAWLLTRGAQRFPTG
jgi:hypothetical protein